MIRKMLNKDISTVCDIWLRANLEAHAFIPAEYWQGNLAFVKEALPQAEVYVFEAEDGQTIQGFIGLNGEHIEGLFVRAGMQSHGIGKRLLDYAKRKKARLSLNVYQKNARALSFYQREGFEIQREGLDPSTGEMEYVMEWHRGDPTSPASPGPLRACARRAWRRCGAGGS